jgi:hypothetical protein
MKSRCDRWRTRVPCGSNPRARLIMPVIAVSDVLNPLAGTESLAILLPGESLVRGLVAAGGAARMTRDFRASSLA